MVELSCIGALLRTHQDGRCKARHTTERSLVSQMSAKDKLPADVSEVRLTVVGAGLMGHSIAGVFSAAGATTTVTDPLPETLASVTSRVADQHASRGIDPTLASAIHLVADVEEATSGSHLVIEAIPEKLNLKQDLFERLGVMLPYAVLATNTSVLKIGDVAATTSRPARVIGTHWFNPPHLVPLVEVIQSEDTDFAYVDWMMSLLSQVGKLPVHVRKDVPGFVGNRLQHALWREAMYLVETGVCDAETVDIVARNSFGMRLAAMGPIENADYVGLDLTLAVHEYVFPSLSSSDSPSPLLIEHFAKGELGAKTGSGFLEWPPGRREEAAHRLDEHLLKQITTEPETPLS